MSNFIEAVEIELQMKTPKELSKTIIEQSTRIIVLEKTIEKAIEYIEKEYDTYDKGIFIVDQYDQPIYVDEIYGALLNILKGSEE